jgi:hypothetical protein
MEFAVLQYGDVSVIVVQYGDVSLNISTINNSQVATHIMSNIVSRSSG